MHTISWGTWPKLPGVCYETTVSTVHFTCTQCQWPVWCGSLDSILMPNYDHQTTTSHILNPPCTSDPECGIECGTECFTHTPRSHTAGSCSSNKNFNLHFWATRGARRYGSTDREWLVQYTLEFVHADTTAGHHSACEPDLWINIYLRDVFTHTQSLIRSQECL